MWSDLGSLALLGVPTIQREHPKASHTRPQEQKTSRLRNRRGGWRGSYRISQIVNGEAADSLSSPKLEERPFDLVSRQRYPHKFALIR